MELDVKYIISELERKQIDRHAIEAVIEAFNKIEDLEQRVTALEQQIKKLVS